MLAPTPLQLAAPLLIVASLLLSGCQDRTEASVEDAARPVLTARAVAAAEAAPRDYAGTIKPRREADLAFRAGGRILARAVDLGTRVTKGEVLARLDPADLALAVRSAEADLAGAEAQDIQAQADANRSRILRAQGWTPASTDEQKQATARVAAEKVRSARAALTLAQNKLAYAELRAPADGIVTAVLADAGAVVAEGQSVLRLADADALEVEVPLPETALASAGKAAAQVRMWAHQDQPFPVVLREIAGAATPGLRTYAARFALAAPPPWLAIGMSATISLQSEPGADLVALPAAAIGDRGQGPMVWIVDEAAGRVAARPVRVAAMTPSRAVVAGVAPGEIVVSVGVQKLDPAAHIRVAGE